MEPKKIANKMNRYFLISLAVGLLLLAGGLAMQLLDVHLVENNKAVVGLSFMPLALATYFGITTALMKRNPKYLRSVMTEQADERIASMKQRADSITYRTMRWALTFVFLGYTFAFPSEIFETAGWGVAFAFFFMAHMMQGITLTVLMSRDQ
jgi:hypothetical protein